MPTPSPVLQRLPLPSTSRGASKYLHPAPSGIFPAAEEAQLLLHLLLPTSKCCLPRQFSFALLGPLDALALCCGKMEICLPHRRPALCLQPLLQQTWDLN